MGRWGTGNLLHHPISRSRRILPLARLSLGRRITPKGKPARRYSPNGASHASRIVSLIAIAMMSDTMRPIST
ncbi:MAG: hypothetical protein ACI81R_003822 [Bradymonadia bacterium]|jgi:hypothetical protein